MMVRYCINQKKRIVDTNLTQVDLPMSDLADAIALPSFFATEAIDAMDKVVSKADEIKKAEREAMIMNFIMGLLCMFRLSAQIDLSLLTQ